MKIGMESAELQPEWNEDNIDLSKDRTLSGWLYLENIKSVRVDEQPYIGILEKKHDSSDISHFEIKQNKVIIFVSWINYFPTSEETDVYLIEIKAEKIYWENVPSLFEAAREN